MNTNRNIPYIYNVKDIDWTDSESRGYRQGTTGSGRQPRPVVARQGVGNHPVETLYPGYQPDQWDATLKLVPGEQQTSQSWKSNGLRQEETFKEITKKLNKFNLSPYRPIRYGALKKKNMIAIVTDRTQRAER